MQLSKQFADISFKTESKLEHLSSPVNSYNIMNSPEQKITMVESQIKNVSDTPGGSNIKDTLTSADKSKVSNSGFSASYRSPSESESVSSSIREGFTSTARYGTNLGDSSKLSAQNAQSTIYNSGYNLGASQQGGLNTQLPGQLQGAYQAGSGLRPEGRYDSSTYQSSSQSSFQSGTGAYQSSSYQSGSGAGTFQAGTYQPGTYQASSYQPQQGSGYQPYQGSGNLYGSSSLYKSGVPQPKPADKK